MMSWRTQFNLLNSFIRHCTDSKNKKSEGKPEEMTTEEKKKTYTEEEYREMAKEMLLDRAPLDDYFYFIEKIPKANGDAPLSFYTLVDFSPPQNQRRIVLKLKYMGDRNGIQSKIKHLPPTEEDTRSPRERCKIFRDIYNQMAPEYQFRCGFPFRPLFAYPNVSHSIFWSGSILTVRKRSGPVSSFLLNIRDDWRAATFREWRY